MGSLIWTEYTEERKEAVLLEPLIPWKMTARVVSVLFPDPRSRVGGSLTKDRTTSLSLVTLGQKRRSARQVLIKPFLVRASL